MKNRFYLFTYRFLGATKYHRAHFGKILFQYLYRNQKKNIYGICSALFRSNIPEAEKNKITKMIHEYIFCYGLQEKKFLFFKNDLFRRALFIEKFYINQTPIEKI